MKNFDALTTQYSAKNAYSLGLCAKLVYQDPSVIENTVKNEWGMKKFNFIHQEETECFIAGDDQKIIVAFRGTEPTEIKDIRTNVKFILVDGYLEGKVHRGFKEALELVWDEMVFTLNQFQDQDQSLWFTGHSLGAALATLAVAKLIDTIDPPIYGLYTFGQPRVGNKDFAKSFDIFIKERTFRFVNNNDAVTRLPFRSMGYRHIGTSKYINHDFLIHHDISPWQMLLDNIEGRLEEIGKPGTDGVKDHDMSLYLHALELTLPR